MVLLCILLFSFVHFPKILPKDLIFRIALILYVNHGFKNAFFLCTLCSATLYGFLSKNVGELDVHNCPFHNCFGNT